jgi:hypothetical protein
MLATAPAVAGTPGPPGSVIKPSAGLLSPRPLSVMVKLNWVRSLLRLAEVSSYHSPPGARPVGPNL